MTESDRIDREQRQAQERFDGEMSILTDRLGYYAKTIRTPEQIEADFEAMKKLGVNEDFGGRRE